MPGRLALCHLLAIPKLQKTRWLELQSVCKKQQKSNASPYLELDSAPLHRALKHTKVHVPWPDDSQEEVLCDLVPILIIKIVLLVPLRPEILFVTLSNQKVNILTGAGHGRFPLVLKTILVRKFTTVTLQIAF